MDLQFNFLFNSWCVLLNTSPKPDIFVILFIAFAIKLLLREQYFKSIILLGIATGVKIVGIFPLIFLTLYLFINKKLLSTQKYN